MAFYEEINNAQIHLANTWWDFMKKSKEIDNAQIRGGILCRNQ